MNHKRTAVQLSVDIAKRMKQNFGDEIKIDMDLLIAGAILIDIGKLIEYDKVDGKLVTSKAGHLLRHPFSGVSIADRFGLPYEVQHIIAYHAKEGDLAKRNVEAIIVHHADFVSFDPFERPITETLNLSVTDLCSFEKIAQKFAFGLDAKHEVHAGDYLSIKPAYVMTHDNTGAVIPKFKSIGATKLFNPTTSSKYS